MKNTRYAFLISFFFIVTSLHTPSNAQEKNNNINFSANIGFVSDYVFRGISQSDKNFAVQGGFDAEHESGLYMGTWASNIDFNDGDNASAELDVYGGYGFSFKGLSFDLGAIYYAYPNANSSLNYNFYEVYAGVGTEIEKVDLNASLNYTPENFGESGDATYLSLNADYKITDDLKFKSNIGYQMIDDEIAFGTDDYLHWGLGIGYSFEGFDFDVKYSQSDLDVSGSCGSSCDPTVIFGISRSF
jgi:uncharacterized protein (TIGR02001 family)